MTSQEKMEFQKSIDQTHLRLVGMSEKDIANKPYWKSENPLSDSNYAEMIDWGVSQLVDKYGLETTEAEKEISWLMMETGMKNA